MCVERQHKKASYMLRISTIHINFVFANTWQSTYIQLITINSKKVLINIHRYIQFTVDVDRNV